MTNIRHVIEQNQQTWERAAAAHAEDALADTRRHLQRGEGYYVDAHLRRALREIGVAGKAIAQFNCNNGRELISVLQLGAAHGYGFDISERYVEQARSLAGGTGVRAEFVAANIYDIPSAYDGVADVIFVTAAALCWMPDLRRYFSVAHRVLRGEGHLVVYETHPFAEMFKLDCDRDGDEALVPHYKYGKTHPVVFDSRGDYYGDRESGAGTAYWYHHSLSNILQSMLDAGFSVRRFDEYRHDVCVGYRDVERFRVRPPLSFLVRCERG